MLQNLVKVKNKETGLFWYGFSKGEKKYFDKILSSIENEQDREEENCTHYDLNNEKEYNYVMDNFIFGKHQIITI